jgi:hypothetical protein
MHLKSAWSFNHDTAELTWLLPSGKSDHLALGTRRTWGCLCELPGFGCPYHIALEHWSWLSTSSVSSPLVDSPLFPAVGGGAASKVAVVLTFEALGAMIGQPPLESPGRKCLLQLVSKSARSESLHGTRGTPYFGMWRTLHFDRCGLIWVLSVLGYHLVHLRLPALLRLSMRGFASWRRPW